MSKDPAVLFYTSDFISGTLTMTHDQRGKYILLLCLQHQKGYLTEKDMLNICGTYDEDIWQKFCNIDGKFYNRRMKAETLKRAAYSESRRKNRAKKETSEKDVLNISKTYDVHMENENENENINGNEVKNKKVKRQKFEPPTEKEVINYFLENGYTTELAKKVFNYYSVHNWHDSKGNAVKNWKQKMIAVWFKPENKKEQEPFYPKYKNLHDDPFYDIALKS
ncbi:MAG: hypothetical protein EOM23_01460 [Candidatus Moranbacteria bacterium]|nr:hypothetical protein [Candidatus Moranbacteria bacterium]